MSTKTASFGLAIPLRCIAAGELGRYAFNASRQENRLMNRLIAISASILLMACAQSSGVLKMGPDTYSVSASADPARGGYSEARKLALTEAN